MTNSGKSHWETLKWLMKYLKGSIDLGLIFKMDKGVTLKGYTSSDFVGDRDNKKSTSLFLHLCITVVSWKFQLQNIVALLSTEAEYISNTNACKEGIWLNGLLKELGLWMQILLFSLKL